MENLKFVWTSKSLMFPQRKIHTRYLFIDEVINIVAEHEVHTFLDGFFDTIKFP